MISCSPFCLITLTCSVLGSLCPVNVRQQLCSLIITLRYSQYMWNKCGPPGRRFWNEQPNWELQSPKPVFTSVASDRIQIVTTGLPVNQLHNSVIWRRLLTVNTSLGAASLRPMRHINLTNGGFYFFSFLLTFLPHEGHNARLLQWAACLSSRRVENGRGRWASLTRSDTHVRSHSLKICSDNSPDSSSYTKSNGLFCLVLFLHNKIFYYLFEKKKKKNPSGFFLWPSCFLSTWFLFCPELTFRFWCCLHVCATSAQPRDDRLSRGGQRSLQMATSLDRLQTPTDSWEHMSRSMSAGSLIRCGSHFK